MARAILALKSCNLHGCARMARAVLALKFCQWHYTCVQEWLEPFWHCQQYLSAIMHGLSHSGTQVMQLGLLHGQLGAIQSGSSHSGTDSCIKFSNCITACIYMHGRARMAQAILVYFSNEMAKAIMALNLVTAWPCQNGSRDSRTDSYYIRLLRCLEPFWHDQLHYLYVISAIMA